MPPIQIIIFIAMTALGCGVFIYVVFKGDRPATPSPDCPKCNYRRTGERLKKLKANFCPACGHLLTDHDTAKWWMFQQRRMLEERAELKGVK